MSCFRSQAEVARPAHSRRRGGAERKTPRRSNPAPGRGRDKGRHRPEGIRSAPTRFIGGGVPPGVTGSPDEDFQRATAGAKTDAARCNRPSRRLAGWGALPIAGDQMARDSSP